MQEWFVREHCEPSGGRLRFDGAATASPAPGVLEAIADADTVARVSEQPGHLDRPDPRGPRLLDARGGPARPRGRP